MKALIEEYLLFIVIVISCLFVFEILSNNISFSNKQYEIREYTLNKTIRIIENYEIGE